MKKIRAKGYRFWTAGFLILYLAVNIWILYRLFQLKEYMDIIALSCPAGSITESAYDLWRENEESGMYSGAAVWKDAGKFRIVSEDTGRMRETTVYRIKGQPGAIFGKELTQGRYFTKGENDLCLLDRGTVRQLFGADNVSGLQVQMDGDVYQIAGILKGNTPICVVPAGKNEIFDGIAVRKRHADVSSDQAVSALETSPGCIDGQRVDGHLYFVTAWLFYALISAAAVILTGNAVIVRKKTGCSKCLPDTHISAGNKIVRYMAYLWVAAMAAGILVLGVKTADPGSDYLPSYWSDFEFFAGLFRDKAQQIRTLSMHQEFASWGRMLGIWRQAAAGELSAGILAVILVFTVKCSENIRSPQNVGDME